MTNTLTITTNFGNKYELAKARLSKNKFFNEQDWLNTVRGTNHTDLDMYIAALDYMPNIDEKQFYEDYNYKYADSKTRVAAIVNEFMKDKISSSIHTQERPTYDVDGNVVMKDGKPVMEKYEVSDYDYYKSIIKQQNDYNYQEFLRQVEQERKDSLNGFNKAMADIVAVPLNVLSVATSVVDGVIDSVSALAAGVEAAIKGERFDDAFVSAIADEGWRVFNDLPEDLVDFESRYTDYRDLDGNYTNLGKYASGVSTSVGQMLPSMLITYLTAPVIGQLVFYESMFANDVRDMYNQFSAEGVSVPSAAILNNAAIKSTLEFAVEKMLGKILGGSVLDDLVFGRTAGKTVGKVTGKSLTKNAIGRILKDAGQEGLEEVIQDTSSFLVDRAYMTVIDENFGEITDLTWQSLMDAFIIGSVISLGGSAVSVLRTNAKVTEKLAAWEYGLNIQSFVENYNTVMEADKKTRTKVTSAAMTEMYSAYRIIASMYGEMGEARFKAANQILDKITADIEAKKFDLEYTRKAAKDVYDSVFGENNLAKELSDKIENEIEEASITEIVDKAVKGEELSVQFDESTKQSIENIFNTSDNIDEVVVAKDGKRPISVRKNNGKVKLAIPANLLNNSDFVVTQSFLAEQSIVDSVLDGFVFYKIQIADVLKTFKDVTGLENATEKDAIWSLMFDKNCELYKILLKHSNMDMQKFLQSITLTVINLPDSTYSEAIYKKTLNKIRKNMNDALKEYLVSQPNATIPSNIFTKKQVEYIESAKFDLSLGTKIISGETLTDFQQRTINKTVEALPISSEEKSRLLKNLKSTSASVRSNAVRALTLISKKSYYSEYDGVKYYQEFTLPASVANNFLRRLGLTKDELLDEKYLTDVDRQNIGQINRNNIFNYRKQQFENATNGRYTFTSDLQVYDTQKRSSESYKIYKSELERRYTKNITGTQISKTDEKRNITKNLLDKSLPESLQNIITINDLILNPDFLNVEILKLIENEYGSVNSESTYLYLRSFIPTIYNGIGLGITDTNEVCYIDVSKVSQNAKEKITAEIVNKASTVYELPLDKSLKSKCGKTKIKVISNDTIVGTSMAYVGKGEAYLIDGEYVPVELYKGNTAGLKPVFVEIDTIFVSEASLRQKSESITYDLLHEIQHIIQYRDRLNHGNSNVRIRDLYSKNKKQAYKIIKDLDNNVPDLFSTKIESLDDLSPEVLEIADDFLYYSCGESSAFGMDNSNMLTMYPIMSDDNGNYHTPWGTVYEFTSRNVVKNGIELLVLPSDTVYEKSLLNVTDEFSIEQFEKTPKSCFILPDGTLRSFGTDKHHYEIISDITNSFTDEHFKNYFDCVPQISVQREGNHYYISVRINPRMSQSSLSSVLTVMDTLYKRNIEFDLGSIYYEDVDPFDVSVFSDEADNSDELLDIYCSEAARARRSRLGNFSMVNKKSSANIETETEQVNKPKRKSSKSSKTTKTEKPKSRYLSWKEAQGTPLEAFYKKGKRVEMSDELKAFVKDSNKVNLPYELENKIKNGTLKTADVMDWFRNTDLDKMDQKVFELINKSYFKNDTIKTPEQLREHIYASSYYYATRAVVRASGNYDLLNVDNDEVARSIIDSFKNISDTATIETGGRKVKVKTIFNRIVNNYYYKGKNQNEPIDISEKYARTLWMRFYDGSLQTGGRIASISKWVAIRGLTVTGELKTYSLDAKVDESDAESDTLLDLTEDKEALQNIVDIVTNSDVSTKTRLIRDKLKESTTNILIEKYGVETETYTKIKKAWSVIDNLSKDQLNDVAVKSLLSELLGIDVNAVLTSKPVDTAVSKVERTSWSVVNNTQYHVSKIRKYLPKAQVKLFLKENSDLFTEDLRLRPEVTKKPDVKGKMVYKDVSELVPVFDRVKEIAEDVENGAYQNRTILNQFIKAKRTMLAVQEDYLKRLSEPVKKAKDVKTIIIEVADDVLSIDTTKPMPKALERILDFEFTKAVKSRTQYVTNDDDYHFEVNNKVFTDTNAEYLASLTQQDVDDIIEYYTHSEILKLNISESKYRLYNAVKLYMSVYLLSNSKSGRYILTEEQYTSLEKSIELMISPSAQLLATWKGVKDKLKPEKTIINAIAKSSGIQLLPEDVENITEAVYSGDIRKLQDAKQRAYLNAKKTYEGRVNTFWDKLFQFERMAMLSGPGTWIRNLVSNATIGGIYYKDKQVTGGLLGTAEKVGESASKLVMKLFPKKFYARENQFKISGTQVTSDVKNFIDVNLIKSGLLNEITDGLSKYDIRKSKHRTGAENLTDIIARSIESNIFYANTSNNKYLSPAYNFIFKMLSDDKYVTRNMIKYLGKMLTEDKVDLHQGMTTKITDYIAEAYTLAAQDYMHKSNVWNKIDQAVRDRMGPAAYFAYKQFFTFTATSWNWFMEGLNYSPVGLIKAIRNYAKLENTINKLDEARRKGDTVISSRFAEYTVRRNIGKGVIGTIGTTIGALLLAFGVAKLDEEDDKYKLTIGDVTVDISDVFGTQGIFMGMAITDSIIKTINDEEYDVMDVLITTLDSMLMDSAITDVWTTIRYNRTPGEWFAALPMQTLNNCVPNFLKTLSGVIGVYDAKFDEGLLGKIEKIAVDAVPGLVYAMPKQVDIYTGEYQLMYKAQFITELVNRLSPFDISPLNLSEYEQEAFKLDINKGMLSGKYTINDKDLVLNAVDVQQLNQYYGKLNKKDLEALLNNQLRLKVKDEKGNYSNKYYSQMTEKQKRAAFEQVMSKNSSYAKVYILTSKGYKYYASDSEYKELRKLGITKNVYRRTNKLNGFVEP